MIATTALLAVDFRAIGLTTAALVGIAFVALLVRNIYAAKPELGSEIELAPNRKPYLSDEELEGTKLDRSLTFALVMLAILAVALPFYWLAEPGRQSGSEDAYNFSFEVQGEDIYLNTAQCVNCHAAGGTGGVAPYVLQDADGQFLANASWKAPALNNILNRYSEEEVRYILNFGRPGSPMAAWGTPGGGPLTTQQVDNVIAYLRTIQIGSLDPTVLNDTTLEEEVREELQLDADEIEARLRQEVDRSIQDGEFDTVGEAVFNLGFYSDYDAGASGCARCHTAGWSLGPVVTPGAIDPGTAGCGGGNPSGIGFSLCGGQVHDRFPNDAWKRADGSWMPRTGLSAEGGGFYIEDVDGNPIALDDAGLPVNDEGQAYIILDEVVVADAPDGASDDEAEEDGSEEAAAAPATAAAGDDQVGDLADCSYVSQLWQPSTGQAYPFAQGFELELDENEAFIDPPVLDEADVPGELLRLADGRLAGECTIVEMPDRTSWAHFDFIAAGADAGSGYGRGGQSTAGLMPGFAGSLPADYIQAVVDYERGL